MRNTFKRSLLVLSVAASIFIVPTGAQAANGLQSEMNKLFGEMSNTTPPGVFETQRRGVLSGGRYTQKGRIFEESLVSFTPPSYKAGCGGVDLFGGSLSFISADQLVELLRSVASNAKGYAFQLALDNVFPDGAKWIEAFQKKVQQLNSDLGNSCQLAKSLMDNSGISTTIAQNAAAVRSTVDGLFDDFFEATQQQKGEGSPEEKLMAKDPTIITGNVIWDQLKNNNTAAWFTHGDDNLLEAIMSMTGSIVIKGLIEDPIKPSEKTIDVDYLSGNKIKLSELIDGGKEILVYSCKSDLDKCLTPEIKQISITGSKNQILDMFLGTSSSPGVIYKYATNSGSLTDEEKAFVSNLPIGIGAIVRNLSVLSHDAVSLFVTETSGAIALNMMYNFTDELFRAAIISMANSESSHKKEVLAQLDYSQQKFRNEYIVLISQYGELTSQIEKYNNLLDNIRKQKYMLATLSSPPITN